MSPFCFSTKPNREVSFDIYVTFESVQDDNYEISKEFLKYTKDDKAVKQCLPQVGLGPITPSNILLAVNHTIPKLIDYIQADKENYKNTPKANISSRFASTFAHESKFATLVMQYLKER